MVCQGTVGTIVSEIQADCIGVGDDWQFCGVSTDSRQISQGQLFVALRGDNFDGHKFAKSAIEQGALLAIVDHLALPELPSNLPLLVVKNTLTAYQQIAHWWRKQLTIPIIGITGSAGKTTTKELITALLRCFLSQGKEVHKSIANHNNEIGVAQTLLKIDPHLHQFAVVEMAMRGRGQIAQLARIAQPNIGVITNIGTAHIGLLGSQRAIAEAKCELLAEMPSDSVAVLNANDDLLLARASEVWTGRVIYFGLGKGEVNGRLLDTLLQVTDNKRDLQWQMPLLGEHNALNFLAGLGVVKSLDLDLAKTQTNLLIDLPEGRATTHNLRDDILLFDETYNASPSATIASLRLLANTAGKRRWAVLGANLELGALSQELHQQIGRTVHELGIDFLVILADSEAQQIANGVPSDSAVTVFICDDREAIVSLLIEKMQRGDRILCKASHSVQMDQVVQQIKAVRP
jgi:UDP-N-acetylmuramoyl-tripeptide--D-alanyl-D-alanine ligase